jgi:selenophosphate synthetase-related protein
MGGRSLCLVDTLVAPEDTARRALSGLRFAADLYGVPIVGGHLTVREGPASLSAFVVGQARALLSARNLAPGQTLLLACCLEGRMRADFPFFSSIGSRVDLLRDDLELLPRAAEERLCVAAKDVSMAGVLGSLAMLLEGQGVGVTVELGQMPRPAEVPLATWLSAFPSVAFLLCCPPEGFERCCRLFHDRDLACAPIGTLDTTAELRVRSGEREALLADLRHDRVTGLRSNPIYEERTL